MSRQKSTDELYTGPYRKPRFDLYSVLLLLALAAIITATVLLYLETTDYPSPPFKGTPQVFWQTTPGTGINSPMMAKAGLPTTPWV